MRAKSAFYMLAFMAVLLFSHMAPAAEPSALNFKERFNDFSPQRRPFPQPLELYDFDDNKSTLNFGKDGPWRLINFWAVWCGPCVAELPSLKVLQDKTKNSPKFKVLLVSDDMPPSGKTLKYVIGQKNLPDVQAYYVKDFTVTERFDIIGLPTTILVSPEGQIVATMVGDNAWDSPDAKAFFKSMLPADAIP